MAASVLQVKRSKFMNMYAVVGDVTLDASYPTGGYVLTPESFGLTTFDFVLPSSNKGYIAEFDHATNKMLIHTGATTQVTAATNLATVKVRVMAMGT